MLIYTHAFDRQHTLYRLLLLFKHIGTALNIEQIRIFDFMLAFPSYLKKVRKTKNIKIRTSMNKYEFSGSYQQCFFLMEQIQISFLLELVSKNIIIKNETIFEMNIKYSSVYEEILKIETTHGQQEALNLISGMFSDIDMLGKDGLKARTHLMESIYDPKQ